MIRRATAGIAALVLSLAAVLLAAPAAQAHNVLQSTDPAAGSTVPYVPEMVTLTFNEPVLFVGTQVMVHTADDTMVNIGPPILVDNTVSQAVTGELPAGEYTVLYRVTSADGHPIEDQFTFTAAESMTYGATTPAPSPTPTTSAEVRASESAAPSPSPTPTPMPPAAEARVSGAVLVAIVAALVVVGGVVAWLLLRRRPDGSPTDPPTDPSSGAAPGP